MKALLAVLAVSCYLFSTAALAMSCGGCTDAPPSCAPYPGPCLSFHIVSSWCSDCGDPGSGQICHSTYACDSPTPPSPCTFYETCYTGACCPPGEDPPPSPDAEGGFGFEELLQNYSPVQS